MTTTSCLERPDRQRHLDGRGRAGGDKERAGGSRLEPLGGRTGLDSGPQAPRRTKLALQRRSWFPSRLRLSRSSVTVAPATRAPSGSTTTPLIERPRLAAAAATTPDARYQQQKRTGDHARKPIDASQPLLERAADPATRTDWVWKTAERRTFQCTLSVVAESRPQNVWVGLLARRCRACSAAASPSPAIRRVVVRSSVLTHSGGTAPDSHRTSLLCPSRAPKLRRRYITSARKRRTRPGVLRLPSNRVTSLDIAVGRRRAA